VSKTEKNLEAIEYAHWLHRRRVGAMSETEKNLERALGFALLDPDDPRYSTHWLVLHPPEGFDLDEDDEWHHPTIRRGGWPQDSKRRFLPQKRASRWDTGVLR
jgi:hypothetical protein